MTVVTFDQPIPCPVCSKEPYVEECWARGPWAVGCYGVYPTEHFVGTNGDSKLAAIRAWNLEATNEHAHTGGREGGG